jgi:hypothetical protein
MNVESILTGVITGVLTGGITGYFGVLFAFKQLRRQRAFDRQLEWYERTVRALSAVPYLHRSFAVQRRSGIHDDRTKVEFGKALLDLRQCVSEAPLYAEQSSYEQLQNIRIESKSDPEELAKATEEAMQELLIELSRPVRKMLRLKAIASKAPKK